MALSHSPSIVKTGLVAHFDVKNKKSFKGPDISNLWKYNVPVYTGTYAGMDITYTTETINIPSIGKIASQKCRLYNDYPNTSGNCCPILFRNSYHSSTSGTPVSPSTLYTYAIVYKTTSGYTHPNFMYRYEYDDAMVKQTEGGVHSTIRRTHLGDGWYWAWGTFTTQPSTTIIGTAGSFYYKYGTTYDDFYVAKYLLVEGDYTNVHPKYWPELNSTRANNQSFYSLKDGSYSTVLNPSYGTDGELNFDGLDGYVALQNQAIPIYNTSYTLEAWIKRRVEGVTHPIIGDHQYYWQSLRVSSNGTLYSTHRGYNPHPTTNDNNITGNTIIGTDWTHVAVVFDKENGKRLYVNGELDAENSNTQTFDLSGESYPNRGPKYLGMYNPSAFGVGSYYFDGQIENFKGYVVALSADEIKQNFEALRGRYGI